ncbi:DUF6916 family protein [Desulfobacter sp.]|uniref:DUF6916 family protein n=1 Tax=Desulfobacter sp. TaxID=2294 RepID=UPI003D0A7AD9
MLEKFGKAAFDLLEKLNKASFDPYLNDSFEIDLENSKVVNAKLIEVQDTSSGVVESFSLIFQAPATAPFYQGTYKIKHEKMGEFPVFMVPVGPRRGMLEYQVIFSRLKTKNI